MNLPKDNLVVVIPARGGSKRIKGKNIRPLAGKPLVHHAIEYALQLEPKTIIVSTDSDEVTGVVRTRYPEVRIDRSFKHTDESTVDEISEYFYKTFLHDNEVLVTIQPTMIGDVVRNVTNLLGYTSFPRMARCSGLRMVSGLDGPTIQLPAMGHVIDIDTMEDFARAEAYLRKKTTIGIYYKAGEKQGWGHKLRAEALADALQDYDVECMDLYEHGTIRDPIFKFRDIQILDVGDTPEKLINWRIRGSKVITIEDDGPGARLAHASVNPFTDLKYAVLRPEFYNLPEYTVRDEIKNILITFGGQDNHEMSEWVVDSMLSNNHGWESWVHSLVVHPKRGQMAAQMLTADLVFCAGGQTAYEAIKVGVPTIAIPALSTEAMRSHLFPQHGIINLGITPTKDAVWETISRLMKDKMLREDMSRRMKATRVGDGALHIRRLVEDLCQP